MELERSTDKGERRIEVFALMKEGLRSTDNSRIFLMQWLTLFIFINNGLSQIFMFHFPPTVYEIYSLVQILS